jgi:hypothetical protein
MATCSSPERNDLAVDSLLDGAGDSLHVVGGGVVDSRIPALRLVCRSHLGASDPLSTLKYFDLESFAAR